MSVPFSSASLYVGDLAPEVNDTYLFDLFKDIGPIQSIRVCKDAITFCSLGYAYVNFHNVADAERAIEQFNNTLIMNKPCRIMWSHRDPAKRKSGVGNVFIKNLDPSINNSALHETFSTFGNILSCKVEVDQNGNSKGYGYVHFGTKEEADLAVSKVNGMLLNGKMVYVGPFQPKKERINNVLQHEFTNVFIKNIDPSVTGQELRERFAKFGAVTSAVVMQNEKNESKGFGFVNMASAENAAEAVEALNNTQWGSKVVFVGRAQKKRDREQQLRMIKNDQASKFSGVNVYVKNLDDSIDDDRLRTEFEKFGTITSAAVMRDDKDTSKGFGFVCFSSTDEATRAITGMNSTLIAGKPIYVGLAQRKDDRRRQLEIMHNQQHAMNMRMIQPNMVPMFASDQGMFMPPMGMGPRMMFQPPMVPQMRTPQGGHPMAPSHGRQPFPAMSGYPMSQQTASRGQMRTPTGQPLGQSGQQSTAGAAAFLRGSRKQQQQQQSQTGGNASAAGGQDLQARFKYNSQARNQMTSATPPVQQPFQTTAPAHATHLEAVMGEEGSKQMVGEQLYPHVARDHPALAPKLTGMLLESLALQDLLNLLQNKQLRDEKIAEALNVLKQHEKSLSESTEGMTK